MEPASILKAIKHCLPKESGLPISLHQPSFCGKEWEYVKECLDTGWVSSVGKYVDEFEERLQATTGARFGNKIYIVCTCWKLYCGLWFFGWLDSGKK